MAAPHANAVAFARARSGLAASVSIRRTTNMVAGGCAFTLGSNSTRTS